MKTVLAIAILAAGTTAAAAQYRSNSGGSGYGYGTGSNSSSHSTNGYVTNQGTYVAPHESTNPNSTQLDNYSTRGNVNPSTGTFGTRSPRY